MLCITKVYDTTGKMIHVSMDQTFDESVMYEMDGGIYDVCELLNVSTSLSPVPLTKHWNLFKGE